MRIRYLRRVGWGAFLIQAAAGGIFWHRLPDARKVDLSGSAGPVAAAVGGSPEQPQFNVEAALSELSAAVGRSSDEDDFQERIWACLRTLSPDQVETLLAAALRENNEGTRKTLVTLLFGHLAALAPGRALELAGTLPPEATDATLGLLLSYWAERDLPKASQWHGANLSARPAEYPSVAKAADEWSRWRKSMRTAPLPFGEILTSYRAVRATRTPNVWKGEDALPLLDYFSRTRDWTRGLSVSAEDPNLRKGIHRIWMQADPMGWLEWMRLHRDEGVGSEGTTSNSNPQRHLLFFELLSFIVPQSPESIPEHVVGPLLDQAVSVFLAEGCDFTSENPSNSLVPFRFMSGFGNWVECQPLQASGWLKRHLEAPWIDPLIVTLTAAVAKDDPEAAFKWAARIKDGDKRRQTFMRAHETWRALDPEAADRWAAENAALLRQ
jgi:hypothetical protein